MHSGKISKLVSKFPLILLQVFSLKNKMTDTVDKAPQSGGYDADFATSVPSEYECPICTLVFRDPIQIEECGHRFCQSCFNELKRR